MTEYRVAGTAAVGHEYGSNVGDDDDGDDVSRILETLAEKEGFCGYDRETPLRHDLCAAVKAICEGSNYSGRPEFVEIMAESAGIARRILNERWESVLALANHLLEVKKMTGEELTAFLNEQAEA